MGFIHRLFTEKDEAGNGAIQVLESGIKSYRKANNISKRDTNTLIDKFRSMVPLMHNEAYQTGPHAIGNTQSHFVGYARHATTPPTLYWKVIGEAIVSRTFNEWVEKPSSAEE
jgi:hypothetical protein